MAKSEKACPKLDEHGDSFRSPRPAGGQIRPAPRATGRVLPFAPVRVQSKAAFTPSGGGPPKIV
jgi:hypothetical protein